MQSRDSNGKFAKKSRVDDDWGDENDSGWDDKLAEYAAKKYKSHRCIPEYVLPELNES